MAVMEALRNRHGKFCLELTADKTRVLPFGHRCKQKEYVDFLGFTFYNTRTRKGRYRIGFRTSAKKLKAKRRAVREGLWKRLTMPIGQTLATLNRKLIGHYDYYGVNRNYRALMKFWLYVNMRLFLSSVF